MTQIQTDPEIIETRPFSDLYHLVSGTGILEWTV